MHPISVMIADENASRLNECTRLLEGRDTTVTWTAASCNGLLSQVLALKPRVLLFSLSLLDDEEWSLLSAVRRESPATRIVLLADGLVQDHLLIGALAMGAHGYLEHATFERHLAKAVHSVDQGEAWVPRKILGKLMDRVLH